MNTTTPAVDEYFASLPTEQREALERLRTIVKARVPEWHEEIKTKIPAIRYKGKTVVGLGAFKNHVGLYVMFGQALKLLADKLAPYDTGNLVIRFTPDTPIPEKLIEEIVHIRLKEIDSER